MNRRLWELIVVVIFCTLVKFVAQCSSQRTAEENAIGGSGIRRVLLVRDSSKLAEIEEASSLSLDLPRQILTDGQGNSTTTSLGYQQSSLASLTLTQSAAPKPTGESDPKITRNIDNLTATDWSETLRMERIRPSWLNVASRFKITSSSILEMAHSLPSEFLLRQAFDSPILLKTKLGILEGVRSIKFNKHLYTFLSVPYAKPPVGELRFKAPQMIEKWDGIMQATKWPPFCVQPSMTLASKSSPVHPLSQMMSEDCLYLNIWTPSLKFNNRRRRPVMVWIHGGAFQYGGISVDENDGSALALSGDVVVVTLNYRISAFGFLNGNNRENGPNNVGLLDQRMAMAWVQENIKQFGGDPHQVTLFGESAGGHSVGLHLISPESQPFFKRVIMQSGVPISYLRSYDINADNKGAAISESVSSVMMAKRLKCYFGDSEATMSSSSGDNSNDNGNATEAYNFESENHDNETSVANEEPTVDDDQPILSDQTLECMRNKTSLEILKAMGAPGNAGFFPTGNDIKGFFPHGNIMESFDLENLKVGSHKDFLIGTNTDEGTFMLHYGMPSLFPAKEQPKVDNIEALKDALRSEFRRISQEEAAISSITNGSSITELRSASGTQTRGAQAHLYKPLLKTSTTLLESFMSKSRTRISNNGTSSENATTEWNKETEFGKNVGTLISDILFLCPARSLAKTLSQSGRNVYFYLYAHRSSMSQYHDWIGVTHHDEVEFVFGRPLRLADVYSGRDIEMSQRLMKTWSYFAYTGKALDQLGLSWPKYGDEENNYMILEPDGASIGQRYHDRFCNIYENVISVHLQDS